MSNLNNVFFIKYVMCENESGQNIIIQQHGSIIVYDKIGDYNDRNTGNTSQEWELAT
jgi:hypothetical protein